MPSYVSCIELHEEFNTTNRFWIAHTEQEIGAIIQTSVFCIDKTCFLRPGHICSIHLHVEVLSWYNHVVSEITYVNKML